MAYDSGEPRNIDANDAAKLFGLAAVKQAFEAAEDPFGHLPPLHGEYDDMGAEKGAEAVVVASPWTWCSETDLPARQWLYGKHLIRRFVSVDVAAGGIGKSSVKLVEALAMASGRRLLDKDLPDGRLNVWHYNLEDPQEEIQRRILAAMRHFNIMPEELDGRLFVNSGRDAPLVIAEELQSGAVILRPVVEGILEQISNNQIDVLQVDPFVSSHEVNENDNKQIDKVAKEWSRIADVGNCAINLVHHARKGNGADVGAESARGAGSLIGAARSVVVYNRMSAKEAERADINTRDIGFYFRVQNDKANLAPAESADWYKMESVTLANGDSVGVASRWEWPDDFEGITTSHLRAVQSAVEQGQWNKDPRASNCITNLIANVTGLDPISDAERLKEILKTWISNKVLRYSLERDDKTKRDKTLVRCGEPVDLP